MVKLCMNLLNKLNEIKKNSMNMLIQNILIYQNYRLNH